jgi:hypothetical protein
MVHARLCVCLALGCSVSPMPSAPLDAGMMFEPDAGNTVEEPDAYRSPGIAGDPCGDGADGDADGRIDEGCACEAGATQECYAGPPGTAGVGACARGTQTCVASTEFGEWGPCEGSITPGEETCDGTDQDCNGATDDLASPPAETCDGTDEDCNGVVDDLTSPPAETCDGTDEDCDGAVDEDTSPMTACGVATGACAAGREMCVDGAIECAGAIGPRAEICGNNADDDCDGQVDEGCACLEGEGGAPWQQYLDPRVRCFGDDLDRDPREFQHAVVPSYTSSVWSPRTIEDIDFRNSSTIPGEFCDGSHTGGVFTYFQTTIELPAGPVPTVRLAFSDVDDAVRAIVYNPASPDGCSNSAWYAYDTGASWDLTRCFRPGVNRLVLIHVDDNPTTRALNDVTVTVGSSRIRTCR